MSRTTSAACKHGVRVVLPTQQLHPIGQILLDDRPPTGSASGPSPATSSRQRASGRSSRSAAAMAGIISGCLGYSEPADEHDRHFVGPSCHPPRRWRRAPVACRGIDQVQIDAVVDRLAFFGRQPAVAHRQIVLFPVDEQHAIAVAAGPALQPAVQAPFPASAEFVKGVSADVVDDVGDSGPAGGHAAQQPRLGRMRVHDVELVVAKQAIEMAIGLPIPPGPDRPIEGGNGVPANLEPIELVGQRTGALAGDVDLVARAVDLLEDLEHRSLHAAEDRQHLHVAQASDRRRGGVKWNCGHVKRGTLIDSDRMFCPEYLFR